MRDESGGVLVHAWTPRREVGKVGNEAGTRMSGVQYRGSLGMTTMEASLDYEPGLEHDILGRLSSLFRLFFWRLSCSRHRILSLTFVRGHSQ